MKNEVLTKEESKNKYRDFPGHPGTKNLPSNSGKGGSIPSQGTKIPHAMGQLSLRSTGTGLPEKNHLSNKKCLSPSHLSTADTSLSQKLQIKITMHRSEEYTASKMEKRERRKEEILTKCFVQWHARSSDHHLVILEVYFLITGAFVHHTKSLTGGVWNYSRYFLHAVEI